MAYAVVWGSHQLEVDAAASYLRARAAGLPAGITSALRTHAQQVALFTSRYARQASGSGPFGDVRWWNGVRYVRVRGAAVAPPGGPTSRHEQGLSLDLPAGGPREWMAAHGAAFGWIGGIVKGEPWHFEYQRARDTRRTATPVGSVRPGPGTIVTVPATPAPAPLVKLEDDMPVFMRRTDGLIALLSPGAPPRGLTMQEWQLWLRLGAQLKGGDFNAAELNIVAATMPAPNVPAPADYATKAHVSAIGQRLKDVGAAYAKVPWWYREQLGRPAGDSEVELWTCRVYDGWTLDQVYASIKASAEAKAYATRESYITKLGRRASDQDVAQWSTAANADAIRAGVAGSPEAAAFAKRPLADQQKAIAAARAAK